MIRELRIKKDMEGCGRKRSWPNERSYPGICLEELRKTTKILSQNSRSPGRDLNSELSEYEQGVIAVRQECSVVSYLNKTETIIQMSPFSVLRHLCLITE
jgi:hypothetical protein